MNETQYNDGVAAAVEAATPTSTEIQKLAPSPVIDMLELDLSSITGNVADIFKFHNGLNSALKGIDNIGSLVWQGDVYTTFPYELTGIEYSSSGALPRPKLKLGQINNLIGVLVKQYGNLLGAKVSRIRTLSKFLDAVNFPECRNLVIQSETLNATPWIGLPSVTSASELYDGQNRFWEITKTSTGSSEWRLQPSLKAVNTGDTLTLTISFLAGTTSGVSVGLYDAIGTAWGPNLNSTVRVIEGPGVLAQHFGGLFQLTGLSTSTPTTISITRTYTASGNAAVYIYPGIYTSTTIGHSIKATRVQVESGTLATQYQVVGAARSGNPEADPTQEFPREVFYIDRKVANTPTYIEFELASILDLQGVMIPRRQCVQNTCQWVYKSAECSYTGTKYFDTYDIPTDQLNDKCGKRMRSCELRFGLGNTLPYGGFPGVGRVGYA